MKQLLRAVTKHLPRGLGLTSGVRLGLGLGLALQASVALANCTGVDYRNHLPTAVAEKLAKDMERTPFARGNHWVAQKDGQTLNIIGTMHSGDPRMARIMRKLRPVIAKADAVFFEVTASAVSDFQQDFIKNRNAFLLPNERTLADVLSAKGWTQFQAYAQNAGFDIRAVERLQPWAISTFLVQSNCRRLGFGVNRGLDDRIERFAIRKGIPIGALEDVGNSVTVMARIPVRDQARILETDIALLLSNRPEDATPIEAYFDQSVWQAFLLQPWIVQHYVDTPPNELVRLDKLFNSALLTRRNREWIANLTNLPGERVVVAVGSAHLPGENGILNLLKQQGYTLSRAPF